MSFISSCKSTKLLTYFRSSRILCLEIKQGEDIVSSQTIQLEVLTLPAAAARRNVSRQAMWAAVKNGRVNAVQDDAGDWHVYVDDRLAAVADPSADGRCA